MIGRSSAYLETTAKMGRPNMSGVEVGISIITGAGFVFRICNQGLFVIVELWSDDGPAEGAESSSLRIILPFTSI